MAETTQERIERMTPWRPDRDAYDPAVRVCSFRFRNRTYTAHSHYSTGPEQWPMTIREALTSHYVATVSNWERLPVQLAQALAERAEREA